MNWKVRLNGKKWVAKNKKTVEYSLKTIDNPLSISEYIFNDLPENFKENLPDENKINNFLDKF